METFSTKFVSNVFEPIFAPAIPVSQTDQILTRVQELFLRYGVKALTMDAIAKELGVSKKTLYQYVANKSDLVLQITQSYIAAEHKELDEATRTSKNAIEEMMHMVGYFTTHLRDFNTTTYLELQRYYPSAFALITDYRDQVVLKCIIANLEKGITQGMYRSDVNPEIIGRVYIYALDVLISPQLFPPQKYHFVSLYKEFVQYHLRGILSPKGLKFLEQSQLLKSLEA